MTIDLEAITARAEAATEGPWVWVAGGVKLSASAFMPVIDDGLSPNNGAFIAAARTDVLALVAALRAAWDRIAAVEADLAKVEEEYKIREADPLSDWRLGVAWMLDRVHRALATSKARS